MEDFLVLVRFFLVLLLLLFLLLLPTTDVDVVVGRKRSFCTSIAIIILFVDAVVRAAQRVHSRPVVTLRIIGVPLALSARLPAYDVIYSIVPLLRSMLLLAAAVVCFAPPGYNVAAAPLSFDYSDS